MGECKGGGCGCRDCMMMMTTTVVVAAIAALQAVASSCTTGGRSEAAAEMHDGQRQYSYIVGGEDGWTLPIGSPGQLNYTSWVQQHQQQRPFYVGDILVFQYAPDLHNVLQVEEDDYENCNNNSPLANFSDGNTTISLDKSGMWYFICGIRDHCSLGQKLAVMCIDHKQAPTSGSSKSPNSSPPPFTSIHNLPSMPPTPNLDPPSPSVPDTPTPPNSNPSSSPFLNPPPLILPIDPSSPSSWWPPSPMINVPPPFDSPPNTSTPCECEFLPPPPPPSPFLPSSPPSIPHVSPLTPSSNASPPLKPNPKAFDAGVYLLIFGMMLTTIDVFRDQATIPWK